MAVRKKRRQRGCVEKGKQECPRPKTGHRHGLVTKPFPRADGAADLTRLDGRWRGSRALWLEGGRAVSRLSSLSEGEDRGEAKEARKKVESASGPVGEHNKLIT